MKINWLVYEDIPFVPRRNCSANRSSSLGEASSISRTISIDDIMHVNMSLTCGACSSSSIRGAAERLCPSLSILNGR